MVDVRKSTGDAAGGHWVTVSQGGVAVHLFLEEGVVTKGPRHLIGAHIGHLPPSGLERSVEHWKPGVEPPGSKNHKSYQEVSGPNAKAPTMDAKGAEKGLEKAVEEAKPKPAPGSKLSKSEQEAHPRTPAESLLDYLIQKPEAMESMHRRKEQYAQELAHINLQSSTGSTAAEHGRAGELQQKISDIEWAMGQLKRAGGHAAEVLAHGRPHQDKQPPKVKPEKPEKPKTQGESIGIGKLPALPYIAQHLGLTGKPAKMVEQSDSAGKAVLRLFHTVSEWDPELAEKPQAEQVETLQHRVTKALDDARKAGDLEDGERDQFDSAFRMILDLVRAHDPTRTDDAALVAAGSIHRTNTEHDRSGKEIEHIAPNVNLDVLDTGKPGSADMAREPGGAVTTHEKAAVVEPTTNKEATAKLRALIIERAKKGGNLNKAVDAAISLGSAQTPELQVLDLTRHIGSWHPLLRETSTVEHKLGEATALVRQALMSGEFNPGVIRPYNMAMTNISYQIASDGQLPDR